MKKINIILIGIMLIGTLGFIITSYDSSRILTYFAIIPVLIAPHLLTKTKYKLNDQELFYYYIFIFFAQFLGCITNLYNLTSWYDLFIHFYSGIFTFKVSLFILKKKNITNISQSFKILFCISFVMFVAIFWEFFEFAADNLLNMDLQHQLDTGVVDTMQDMLAAFLGGIFSIIIYLYKNKKKHLVK